jgi:heme exporter protein CcmB
MTEFFRVAWHIVRKDMTVEIRSRELLFTTLLFAVSVVLVFSFAIVREGRAPDDVAAGILWVAISFAGTLAMGRTFERERYNDTLRALLLAPADRPAVYAGKLIGLLLLLGLVEIVLVPLVGLLFSAPIFSYPIMLITLLAAGTIGFAAVGTLFAAMLVRVRSRDTLLPVLLYPVTIPVMIAGVRGTAALFQAAPDEPMARFWIGLLIFWDAIFLTLALWTFEPVMTE